MARRGRNSQLDDVLIVTFQVVGAVVLLSGLLGVPAAYALARRNFPGKQLVILLFLLPMLIPPITFGIPLATVLYQSHLGGNISGVILANMVPTVSVRRAGHDSVRRADRSAHRSRGAGVWRRHRPAVPPCAAAAAGARILAALLLVLVRTIAMFELTFFTAGPGSQTLVVALYYAVYAAGVRAGQSIDAMAVILHDHDNWCGS